MRMNIYMLHIKMYILICYSQHGVALVIERYMSGVQHKVEVEDRPVGISLDVNEESN